VLRDTEVVRFKPITERITQIVLDLVEPQRQEVGKIPEVDILKTIN
jgi:hypothetical protein